MSRQPRNRRIKRPASKAWRPSAVPIAIALFALTFIFQSFVIPSSSMASTLLVGEHILVERVSLAPSNSWAHFIRYRDLHRGDPIVFYKPSPSPTANTSSIPSAKVPGVTAEWSLDLPTHIQGEDLVVPPGTFFGW